MTGQTKSFSDPILRCVDCGKLVAKESLRKIGKCRNCGCRRVRSVDLFTEDEWKAIKAGEYEFGAGIKELPEEFLAQFEALEEE